MEAVWLESQLEAGSSIEAIARAQPVDGRLLGQQARPDLAARREAPRARRLAREQLEPLVEAGVPIRAMAEQLGVSYTTVRHWLTRYGLVTPRARRLAETAEARAGGWETVEAFCLHHGQVMFVRRGTECFRCQRCRSDAVDRRRRKIKRQLVEDAGGACMLCGYSKTMAGLHFHHVDPASKSFGLGERGVTISLAAARAEAAKCVLLCSNCHAEVENGVASLP